METKKGLVTKIISDLYTVSCDGQNYISKARGRLRQWGDIVVGDIVQLEIDKPISNICKVEKRKNLLLRPLVANIDVVIIVLAKEPAPDLLLTDKIIIEARSKGITPIICFNKSDITTRTEINTLLSAYTDVDTIITSATNGEGREDLIERIANNIVCFAGQSATGKTSMLNMLLDIKLKTGTLSLKLKRGKHTTRHVELFNAFGGMIVDTCGFSKFELNGIRKEELKNYYDEFYRYAQDCKYTSCMHVSEPDCAVKRAVESGDLDKNRYLRYINIYKELINSRNNHE
ncbi:MAG: ribosome small subunit-dependent GTPase A [Christensenellaceae bacterium]|jgi:ribosome biogenesis GTPase|nr:ribosome small subunit-dependent GTPase A [Christensenellaceae bacterium]